MKEKPWSRNTNNDGFWLPRLDWRALESAHPGMHQTKHRCNQRTPHNGSAPTEATPNKHPATSCVSKNTGSDCSAVHPKNGNSCKQIHGRNVKQTGWPSPCDQPVPSAASL